MNEDLLSGSQRSLTFVLAAVYVLFSGVAFAQGIAERYVFHIKEATLGEALEAIVELTDAQLIYPQKLATETGHNSVVGRYTIEEALDLLLEGSGFSGGLTKGGMIVISLDQTKTENIREDQVASGTLKKGLLASVATFMFGAGGASAQDGVDGADNNGEPREVIIVTANKREQTLQDTALAVTALTDDELRKRGVSGISDYLNTIPGVTLADRGLGENSVVIRGLALAPNFEVGARGASVGYYFGDVPLTSFGAGFGDIRLVDISRVEVLRGPQGSLYGASSIGGTIKSLPNEPNLNEFQASLELGYEFLDDSKDEGSNIRGVVNVPIIENKLAFRGVLYRDKDAGYIDNLANDSAAIVATNTTHGVPQLTQDLEDVLATKVVGGRVSLRFSPTDFIDATLMYAKQEAEQDGGFIRSIDTNDPRRYVQSVSQINTQLDPDGLRKHEDYQIGNLTVDIDLGPVSLFSSTAIVEREESSVLDFQSIVPPGSFLASAPLFRRDLVETDGFVQEVRVNSEFGGPLQFTVGGYYEKTDRDVKDNSGIFYGGDLSLGLNPFGPGAPAELLLFGGTNTEIEQHAVFGELSYDVTDQIELTFGGRHFSFDVIEENFTNGFSSGVVPAKDVGETFKANLSYRPDDTTHLYAQFAQGFRLQPTTAPLPPSLCDQDNDGLIDGTQIGINDGNRLNPDRSNNYEVGVKKTALDGRATINLAAFNTRLKDLPLFIPSTCGISPRVNAGKGRSRGVELEAAYAIQDNLVLSFSGSFTDAVLLEDLPTGELLAGDRLPGSARWTIASSLQYDFEVATLPVFLRGDINYKSSYYSEASRQDLVAGDYTTVNLKAGVSVGNVDLEAYVKNLTDEYAFTQIGFWAGLEDGYALRPRSVGVTARIQY